MARSLGVVAVLSTLVLSGCLGGTSGDPESASGGNSPAAPSDPADAIRPSIAAPIFDSLVRLEAIGGTEPTIRTNVQDHIFVVSTGENLWRSLDGGATFEAVGEAVCTMLATGGCQPGTQDARSGIDGGGDASIAIDSEGRIFWLGLFGDGGDVPFQYSLDNGDTWSEPYDVADGEGADREWVAVGPNDEVYVVWRGSPDGLAFRASYDHGMTWTERVSIDESNPIDGPLAVDFTTGAMYVGLSHFDGGPVRVARSIDRGANWEIINVPSRIERNPVTDTTGTLIRHFIFPVVAVDAAGTAYVVWADDNDMPGSVPSIAAKPVFTPKVYLSYSTDQGQTWSQPIQLSTDDVPAVLPWIVAGDAGRIAVSWYEAITPVPAELLPNAWNIRLAMTTTADSASPEFAYAQANEDPVHLGSICTLGTGCTGGDRTRGDFHELALRPNGLPIIAYIEDMIPPDGSRRTQPVVARVIDGTSLWAVD